MRHLATLALNDPEEAQSARVRMHSFLLDLTGQRDLAAEITGAFSELARWLGFHAAGALVDVSIGPRDDCVILGLRFRVAAPRLPGMDHGLLAKGFTEQGGAWHLMRSHRLRVPFPRHARIERLTARLSERSRSELFRELQTKNVELRQASDAAHAAARTKADFLANVSHEIRTPMNAVIGMAHLLAGTALEPRQRGYVDRIMQSAQNLLTIINDILDFSKIEAGKMTLETVDFETDRLFNDLLTITAHRIEGKDIELVFATDPAVPVLLRGDPLRIEQILINLVNNAIKFTERGEVSVRCRLEGGGPDSVTLRFDVTDTGVGISAEHQRNLFQSFEQGDASITRRFGGTGLGLAICKQLSEHMGGTCGVESQLGVGSRFWFTLRLQKADTAAVPAPPAALQGIGVHVIDDSPTARAALCETLQAIGCEPIGFASGAECLAALERPARMPGLVLVDETVPGESAIDTAKALRALPGAEGLKIALSSPIRFDAGPDEAAQPFDAVLAKPTCRSVCLETVSALLCPDALSSQRYRGQAEEEGEWSHFDYGVLRVLVVEDNEINREVAVGLFAERGIAVELAENGLVGLRKVEAEPWDIVFMDMQMPVMDGVTAASEIRKLRDARSLPIIALTANAMATDRERCFAAGINDFLTKPINPAELWRVLRRWLPGHTPLTEPSAPKPASSALPEVEGIDRVRSVQNAAGNTALAASVRRSFAKRKGGFPAEARLFLETGQTAELERAAHTLKGTAANIGAVGLSETAAKLENLVRAGASQDAVSDALDAVEAQLAQLLAALAAGDGTRDGNPAITETGLNAVAAEAEASPPSPEELQAFAALLRSSDFAATRHFRQLSPGLRSRLGDTFTSLARAMDDYDHASALALLERTGLV